MIDVACNTGTLLQEGIRLPIAIHFWRGFFLILHGVANHFLQSAKRNLIPFRVATKGNM
jgi:hypothetical protein